MKKYEFSVYLPDDFVEKIRPKLSEAFALKGAEGTDDDIISLLEFCLMLGSYDHIERNLDRYLDSCRSAKGADRKADLGEPAGELSEANEKLHK